MQEAARLSAVVWLVARLLHYALAGEAWLQQVASLFIVIQQRIRAGA